MEWLYDSNVLIGLCIFAVVLVIWWLSRKPAKVVTGAENLTTETPAAELDAAVDKLIDEIDQAQKE